jgi:hypothetical protein
MTISAGRRKNGRLILVGRRKPVTAWAGEPNLDTEPPCAAAVTPACHGAMAQVRADRRLMKDDEHD